MRSIFLYIAMIVILAHAGCASIGVRTGAFHNQCAFYPATRNDLGTVYHAVSMPFRSPSDPTQDAQDGIVYLLAPMAIIDLPLAVTVDTILLPYDLYGNKKSLQDDASLIPRDSNAGAPAPVNSEAQDGLAKRKD